MAARAAPILPAGANDAGSERQAMEFDVAIVGSGVAGLGAASEAASHGLSVVCIEAGPLPGGLIANVGAVDGYPGVEQMAGAALVDSLRSSGVAQGVRLVDASVQRLEAVAGHAMLSTTAGPVRARAVIVASGATLRRLEVPGEAELAGRGVSQCDWCDGGFFKGRAVAVVGGGDAALQAALHLAQTCSAVYVVIRGARLRARQAYVNAAADNERIAFHWETVVEKIAGDRNVTGLEIAHGTERSTLAVDGVFVFAGVQPNTAFLPPAVALDAMGRIVTTDDLCSTLPRVYAAGAVRRGCGGRLVSACGDGAAAAAAVAALLRDEDAA